MSSGEDGKNADGDDNSRGAGSLSCCSFPPACEASLGDSDSVKFGKVLESCSVSTVIGFSALGWSV